MPIFCYAIIDKKEGVIVARKKDFNVEDFERFYRSYENYLIDQSKDQEYVPSIADFCYHAGITYHTFWQYAQYPLFSNVIDRIKLLILRYVIQALLNRTSGSTSGLKFYLKNVYGWTDTKEITQKITDSTGNKKKIDLSRLSDQELDQLEQLLLAGSDEETYDITPKDQD